MKLINEDEKNNVPVVDKKAQKIFKGSIRDMPQKTKTNQLSVGAVYGDSITIPVNTNTITEQDENADDQSQNRY